MSLFGKIKKRVKKASKKVKKASKSLKGKNFRKTVFKAEKTFDSRVDRVLKQYNAHIESKVRNKVLKIAPQSLRSQGIKAGHMLASSSRYLERKERSFASKIGFKEGFDFYNHLNPLKGFEDAGDVLQGKESFLQAGFNSESPYSAGSIHDSMKYDEWKRKKAKHYLIHAGKILNVSGSQHRANLSHSAPPAEDPNHSGDANPPPAWDKPIAQPIRISSKPKNRNK